MKGTYPRPVADIEIKLMQTVLLARDPSISCYAGTWSWFEIAASEESHFENIRLRVKDKLNASLNEFINDYFAANADKRAGKTDPIKQQESLAGNR